MKLDTVWVTIRNVALPIVVILFLSLLLVQASYAPKAATAAVATQQTLCIGIMANTGNPARDDLTVQTLCSSVGVLRSHYGDTVQP